MTFVSRIARIDFEFLVQIIIGPDLLLPLLEYLPNPEAKGQAPAKKRVPPPLRVILAATSILLMDQNANPTFPFCNLIGTQRAGNFAAFKLKYSAPLDYFNYIYSFN
jgi:hypothetical protein